MKVSAAGCNPAPRAEVLQAVSVRSRCGLAEDWRFRLDPGEPDSAVRVGTWAPAERDVAWQSVDWHGLPGRTLFHVCMGVLSVRLFVSV